MNTTESPSRANALHQLRTALQAIVLQDLRSAARAWGWSLRGTAKADVVQGIMEHLTNAAEMSAGFEQLPSLHRKILIWLGRLSRNDGQVEVLAPILEIAEELRTTKEAVTQALGDLQQKLFILTDSITGAFHVPTIYLDWLPETDAPGLVYRDLAADVMPAPAPGFLDDHIARLLAAVETDRPEVKRTALLRPVTVAQPGRNVSVAYQRAEPHAGIVADEQLAAWGYNAAEERALARTLLSLLAVGKLLHVQETGGKPYLLTDATQIDVWRGLSPAARRAQLHHWWLEGWPLDIPAAVRSLMTWDELDFFLTTQNRFSLRQNAGWSNREYLDRQVQSQRVWLAGLLSAIKPEVWISTTRWLDLIHRLRRDHLTFALSVYAGWAWYDGEEQLDPQHFQRRVWNDLFGGLFEGWLGPAYWLGFIQMAVTNERVMAISRPGEQATPSGPQRLPADMLSFLPDGRLSLRNTWQTGELRQLILKIASEVTRDRQAILYALDPAAFRQTLRSGQSADQVIQAFAEAGFPLPAEMQNRLKEWQGRLGRHQLYDNLAVIEFGDEQTMSEVQASIGLSQGDCYPISSRHLVVLRPETVPVLVEELRRKGYTPQVLS